MLEMFPQARAITLLGVAAVLAAVAIAMLALSASHRAAPRVATPVTGPGASTPAVASRSTQLTPGFTAQARQAYRTSLGR